MYFNEILYSKSMSDSLITQYSLKSLEITFQDLMLKFHLSTVSLDAYLFSIFKLFIET